MSHPGPNDDSGDMSPALLIAGALAPMAGRLVDTHGGRPLLLTSSVLFATGLALLARPLRIASVTAALALQNWFAARAQAHYEQAAWELALQDPRVRQELRAAHSRSTDT